MEIKNVTIAGGGVLGSQISWMTAFHGFEVSVYDKFEKGTNRTKELHLKYAKHFNENRGASQQEIDETFSRLTYTNNLAEAVKDADLISESVPENPEIKIEFYKELSKVAPSKTIFTTNSSTMCPSNFAEHTGRPEMFLALHFANHIWDNNVGEIMMHEGTDKKYFDIIQTFAKNIGMVPIPINKEQPGYVLNTLLVPLLENAQTLYFNGVSDHETIDKTWMISTGSKMGPFGIIDMVGMQTLYNVGMMRGKVTGDEQLIKNAIGLKEQFIDKGKMGEVALEGFYKYPNPNFMNPDFLK
ncbi:3-hydroxyacyl-CoA dehydrogenase [Algibacter mikhailovii]|uniref:3-hydroxyacyl-CoA dehydrogenase n=1 Tax=Algibacter mikhailovii TaxID=425498 RepID=UPI0024959AF5|nr:3-hydroxyacyl-CoA dehydrogenase [Algibacter mikhailovii]